MSPSTLPRHCGTSPTRIALRGHVVAVVREEGVEPSIPCGPPGLDRCCMPIPITHACCATCRSRTGTSFRSRGPQPRVAPITPRSHVVDPGVSKPRPQAIKESIYVRSRFGSGNLLPLQRRWRERAKNQRLFQSPSFQLPAQGDRRRRTAFWCRAFRGSPTLLLPGHLTGPVARVVAYATARSGTPTELSLAFDSWSAFYEACRPASARNSLLSAHVESFRAHDALLLFYARMLPSIPGLGGETRTPGCTDPDRAV